MKTLRIFLQFLFVVANVVAVVLLIVSAYSDRVSPETSMTLSYLGLAFPGFWVQESYEDSSEQDYPIYR